MKIIVLLERLKKVTAVAEELNVKQPSISFHMRKLEEEWGVALFEMKTGKVLLTEAGRLLFHYAQQIDRIHTEAQIRMSGLRQTGKLKFVFGSTDAAASALLAGGKSPLLAAPDEMIMSFKTGGEDELYQMLLDGSADLITSGRLSRDAFIQSEQIMEHHLSLLVPRGHPLELKGEPASYRLAGLPFILLEEPSLMEAVRKWEAEEQVTLQIRWLTDRIDLALNAVRTGDSLSIAPSSILRQPLEGIHTMRLPGAAPSWKLYAAWRTDYWNAPLMQRMVERLRSLDVNGSEPL
jgi:DNA-binding transcriptional LysR family regulator